MFLASHLTPGKILVLAFSPTEKDQAQLDELQELWYNCHGCLQLIICGHFLLLGP